MTLTFRFVPRLTLGVEYNPREDEVGPLVNYVAITETKLRPALIVGTSSDRIGTPSGRAYYATFSKDLSEFILLPIAPYAGVSYGTYDGRLRAVGGASLRLGSRLTLGFIHDGHNGHPYATLGLGRHLQVTALAVHGSDLGLSGSLIF